MQLSERLPILTLTTDFGLQDHYVGTVKGVILQIAPQANIVDITHQISPFSILEAAYAIDQAAPFFPNGTIHVVVVDPGVGTSRKALMTRAGHHLFVAPDNGVLSFILRRFQGAWETRELTNSQLFLDRVSSTFHGRDIFAAAAAHLASGDRTFEEAGPIMNGPVMLDGLDVETLPDGGQRGIVISVDQFGNVITNLRAPAGACQVQLGTAQVDARYPTFGAAPRDLPFLYEGSSGYLEVSINGASAAEQLGVRTGQTVRLLRRSE